MKITPYQLAILSLNARKTPLDVVIVGANDGRINDPIWALVEKYLYASIRATLVEPNNSLNQVLSENWDAVSDKKIINACVGEEGVVELHKVAENAWDACQPTYANKWPRYRAPTGVTSTDKQFVIDWLTKCGFRNPRSAVVSETVQSAGLSKLLHSAGREPSIDVLQIDAEGTDDLVLYNCDISKTSPAAILIEVENLPDKRKTSLTRYLESHRYVIITQGANALAIAQP